MSSDRSTASTTLFAGLALILVGLLAAVVALLPLATGAPALPLVVYLLAMLAPLGLGLVLVGLWQQARTRRHLLGARRS